MKCLPFVAVREHLLREIESFFVHYAELNGKRLRIIGRRGLARARKLLKAGARTFDRKP
jgi:inorganic pyrophosphatase